MEQIVAAIIGGVIGAVGSYIAAFLQIRQLKIEMYQKIAKIKRDDAANYLDEITNALSGMIEQFNKGNVPYEEGHTFEKLVEGYEITFAPYPKYEVEEDLRRLKEQIKRAERLDGYLEEELDFDPKKKAEWLADMRRLVGDLKAKAINIRQENN